MRGRLLYLLKFYGLTVLLFIVAKWGFMLSNASSHGVRLADGLDVVAHGLSLDLSTALYFLIIPFLACAVAVWTRVPQQLMKVYGAVVALAFAMAFVADASLYAFWGTKLDASCLQYLAQPEGIAASVSAGYLAVRIVGIALLAVVIWWLYGKLLPSAAAVRVGGRQRQPVRRRIGETLLYVACIPLMVIGIRGGVDESTTNIGQVYYSQNQFLNHSAVNPVFNFLYTLLHQLGNLSQYQFFEPAESESLTASVYTTESQPTDTLLRTDRPDVVIILMESAGEEFASVMPRLQQLKREGISFTQCYANSWRTDRGTVCALSGYPSFPTLSVMKMPAKSGTLPGIAATLRSHGYQTSYLYGGDINFTNMRSYLISTGWERLTSMDDYSMAERLTAQWGVRDDITFGTLYDQIVGHDATDGPALFGYSTLSSHEPWDVPYKQLDDEVLNAFAYLDDCLGRFVDRIRQTPQWDNLLIVLLPDHGINYASVDQSVPLQKNHIPMVWIGGAVKGPREVATICNQTDLAATLLGQMGLPHRDFMFSRDVLSATYVYPTAVHNYGNAQMLLDSTGYILYDFDAQQLTISQSTDADRLLRVNKAILQTTTTDISNR
ncbi:MAG: sulfatase-like hydrolase/transferase [Prevotella sp.]|nr:sulfatase-like hydrolase/transferase [Prevotella sp.]